VGLGLLGALALVATVSVVLVLRRRAASASSAAEESNEEAAGTVEGNERMKSEGSLEREGVRHRRAQEILQDGYKGEHGEERSEIVTTRGGLLETGRPASFTRFYDRGGLVRWFRFTEAAHLGDGLS
jgi:hypothetical protein